MAPNKGDRQGASLKPLALTKRLGHMAYEALTGVAAKDALRPIKSLRSCNPVALYLQLLDPLGDSQPNEQDSSGLWRKCHPRYSYLKSCKCPPAGM